MYLSWLCAAGIPARFQLRPESSISLFRIAKRQYEHTTIRFSRGADGVSPAQFITTSRFFSQKLISLTPDSTAVLTLI